MIVILIALIINVLFLYPIFWSIDKTAVVSRVPRRIKYSQEGINTQSIDSAMEEEMNIQAVDSASEEGSLQSEPVIFDYSTMTIPKHVGGTVEKAIYGPKKAQIDVPFVDLKPPELVSYDMPKLTPAVPAPIPKAQWQPTVHEDPILQQLYKNIPETPEGHKDWKEKPSLQEVKGFGGKREYQTKVVPVRYEIIFTTAKRGQMKSVGNRLHLSANIPMTNATYYKFVKKIHDHMKNDRKLKKYQGIGRFKWRRQAPNGKYIDLILSAYANFTKPSILAKRKNLPEPYRLRYFVNRRRK